MKFRPYALLGFTHWASAVGSVAVVVVIFGVFLLDFVFPELIPTTNKLIDFIFYPSFSTVGVFLASSATFLYLKRFGPINKSAKVLYDSFKQFEMFMMSANNCTHCPTKTAFNVDLANGIRVIICQHVEGRFIKRIKFSCAGMCFPEFEKQTRILIDLILLML